MKTRNGQVALYLVMVLLAIAVLMMVNVNAFLAVRSKNRMMNAVDEAAIAVAKHQGRLLNEIGRMNVEHLRAAVLGEPWGDAGRMWKLAFLGPVDGIARANAAAADWGYGSGEAPEALSGFWDHINEIRDNPDLYPPTEDGVNLWHVYADALAAALGGSPAVLPGYSEMANPGMSGLFANSIFYEVVRSNAAWCWFTRGNNMYYLECDPSLVEPSEITPMTVPENSEIFSLHITHKTWMDSGWQEDYIPGKGFNVRWTNFVCRVTGLSPESFSSKSYAASETEIWAFYDGWWESWSNPEDRTKKRPFVPPSEDPFGFPIAGTIKPEYDVAGCVASCMMLGHIQQIGRDDEKRTSDRTILVTAEAKPLGTVEDLDGGTAPVTAYNRFIAASRPDEKIFTEAQLVLMGSVPRAPGCSMSPDWYEHIKKHSPQNLMAGCDYCDLWRRWADPSFRESIRSWIQENADTCQKGGGDRPVLRGGYEYAH